MAKGVKTGGRQKGSKNKFSSDVKAMILEALNKAGGANYLYEQSQDNPKAFLQLVGRVLPLQVSNDAGEDLVGALSRLADKLPGA